MGFVEGNVFTRQMMGIFGQQFLLFWAPVEAAGYTVFYMVLKKIREFFRSRVPYEYFSFMHITYIVLHNIALMFFGLYLPIPFVG